MSTPLYTKSVDEKDKIKTFFYDYWQHKDLPRRYDLFETIGGNIIVGSRDDVARVFRWKSSTPNTGKYIVGFGGTARLKYQLGFIEEYVKGITSIYKEPRVPTTVKYDYTLSDFLVGSVAMVYRKIIKILNPTKTEGLIFRYDLFTLDEDMDLVFTDNKRIKLTYTHSTYACTARDMRRRLTSREFEMMVFHLNKPTNRWYVDSTTVPTSKLYADIRKDHLRIVEELKGVSDKIKEGKEKGVGLDALLEKKRGLEELLKDFKEECGENVDKATERDIVTWDKIENKIWRGDDALRTVYHETTINKDIDVVIPVVLSTMQDTLSLKK